MIHRIALVALLGLGACTSQANRVAVRAKPTANFPAVWDQAPGSPPPASSTEPESVVGAVDIAPPTAARPAGAPPSLPANLTSVAVLPLQSKGGANPQLVEVLDDLVISALQSGVGSRVRVIGKSDIDAMLGFEKTKDLMGCSDVACAVDMAGALGVDSVLSASAGALGSKLMLTLVWISQQEARVLSRVSQDLGGEVEKFDRGVEQAVQRLLGAVQPSP